MGKADLEAVGLRLRAIRLSRNVSKNDLAEALDVSLRKITLIEKGESAITVEHLIFAARRLGVLVSNIVGDLPMEATDGK